MLTNQDYESRLRQLRENRVLLDQDPVGRGIPYILSKIAEVQAVRDIALDILVEAMQNKNRFDAELRNLEAEHDMEYQGLMANDPDVKAQKSADLRSGLANVKLADLALKVHHTKLEAFNASGYLTIVQKFYDNLQSITSSLNQQISLVQLYYEHQHNVPQTTVPQNKEK